jgi:non-ribosomal peptide synthase protein (TIGR01720 family)
VGINWSVFQRDAQASRIALPTYPFERKRYWIEAPAAERLEPPDVAVEQMSIVRTVPSVRDGNGSHPASLRGLKRIVASQLQLMGEQVALLQRRHHRDLVKDMTSDVHAADSFPLTPIQHWFFEQKLPEPEHWNHSVLLEVRSRAVTGLGLKNIFQNLQARHDALRLRYVQRASGIHQFVAGVEEAASFAQLDLSGLAEEKQAAAILETATQLQASLNLSIGPIMRAAYFDLGPRQPGRLLIIIHHLAVDISSWRILLDELNTSFMQSSRGERIELPRPTMSFANWAQKLNEYAQTNVVRSDLPYWTSALSGEGLRLPVDHQSNANSEHSSRTISLQLGVAETRTLLRTSPKFYGAPVSNILLAVLVRTIARWAGGTSLLVDVEGHGRESIFDGANLSRTVGWFTSIFPVLFDYEKASEPRAAVESVKERMGRVPFGGISYGLLRYSNEDSKIVAAMRGLARADICFNYWVDSGGQPSKTSPFVSAHESSGPDRSSQGIRQHLLEVEGVVRNSQLKIDWHYSQNIHLHSSISSIAKEFMNVLREFVAESLAVPDGVPLRSAPSLAPIASR